ncbi:nucleotidyltransferase domain-containing protein [Agrococcus beijingensis]|uniref:nucleotidyltransferase domain-containing protein n=1 Tax=Agrococcus beijingensis TaxID=3068634 RepID=UPI0027410F8E|nr:nucleotidyltransferase domain-containing protein [Agrococcus sp. REN33]
MNVDDAFEEFQQAVNADPGAVREARERRDLFRDAFSSETDVDEIIASGSLARGTQKDPIHDVDVIIVFDGSHHPDWGHPGESAAAALNHTRERVHGLLGSAEGTFAQEVRLARWRNHAVKCFLDEPEDPDAFTVDAMPALRRDGRLLVPEAVSEDWIACDPEFLIAQVAHRHATWRKFAGTVRMLKSWAAQQPFDVKSLVMEVLALDHLPTDASRPAALKQFFVSAAFAMDGGSVVEDPAGLCGPIQSKLDYAAFAGALQAARDDAAKAIQAQVSNDTAAAIAHWGKVFGADFPAVGRGSTVKPTAVPRPVKDTPQG